MSAATQIILLDHNFNFLNLVSIKKAIKLMCKQKVEVVKSTDKELRCGLFLPRVLRLLHDIGVSLTKKIPWSKPSVFIRDDYTCAYCGKKLNAKTATVDHVHPRDKGGKNSFLNCVTACKVCNNWKGNKYLHETSLHLRYQPTHPSFLDFMYMKAKSFGINMKEVFA